MSQAVNITFPDKFLTEIHHPDKTTLKGLVFIRACEGIITRYRSKLFSTFEVPDSCKESLENVLSGNPGTISEIFSENGFSQKLGDIKDFLRPYITDLRQFNGLGATLWNIRKSIFIAWAYFEYRQVSHRTETLTDENITPHNLLQIIQHEYASEPNETQALSRTIDTYKDPTFIGYLEQILESTRSEFEQIHYESFKPIAITVPKVVSTEMPAGSGSTETPKNGDRLKEMQRHNKAMETIAERTGRETAEALARIATSLESLFERVIDPKKKA